MSNAQLEKNKEIARRFFDLSNSENPDIRDELFSDDAVIETMPRNLGWWSGRHNREKIAQLVRATGPQTQFKTGLHMVVQGLTAEGDRVAVEAESHSETKEGRIYNNFYHFLLTIRDGKIVELKGYFDSLHSAIILYGLGTETCLDAEANFQPVK